MQTSETINELATALAKAQGEITGALKDSANPFFKSKYADLASCWDACRSALSKNGLAVIQTPESAIEDGTQLMTTTLTHSSGQWVRSTMQINAKDDTMQALGSAITYARRYALAAIVGIAQIDDDGNHASGRSNGQAYAEPHRPQGDMAKNVPPDEAEKEAITMRSILQQDMDENIKALRVLDHHDIINRNHELYIAASQQLIPKERSAWKTYVSIGKAAQKADAEASRRF